MVNYYEVTFRIPWLEIEKAVRTAVWGCSNLDDYYKVQKREMIGEAVDWCSENTPSYQYNTFSQDGLSDLKYRHEYHSYSFSDKNSPYYPVRFIFTNLTDATFFKLRWIG